MTTPAVIHSVHNAAPRYGVVGDIYAFVLTGEQTGGAFALIDALVFPNAGPPPHTHSREDETFIVLEGRLAFTAGGRTFSAGPGETVHLPRGHTHTFTNPTDRPARALIHCAPAGIENMFREIGTPLPPAETTLSSSTPPAPPPPVTPEIIQKILAAAPRYGITIHPPAT